MAENMRDILDALAGDTDLTPEQAAFAFRELFEGLLTPAQAGALLMGLRTKGETALELAAAARAGLARARLVAGLPEGQQRIDTCGTGGDRQSSFNCSTAVALYLAALGHSVVKHGNRAVSSSCGSADALEALGLPISTPVAEAKAVLDRDGFVFLFAPLYHPAFAHVVPVRRELGIRTLFNLMGPLLNPAQPTHQILGVGAAATLRLMAETLALVHPGLRALVVHGAGGFDELTPFGPAEAFLVDQGRIEPARMDPAELGFARHKPEEVRVEGKDAAVAALQDVLTGRGAPAMQAMCALNLGAALHLLTGKPLALCAAEAREAVAEGAARRFAGEVRR